jgi:hypothetical protein
MIRAIVDCRVYLSLILTIGVGITLQQRFPFPEDNAVLQLVAAEKPGVFLAIKYTYQTMLFSTPFIGCSMLFSILYIFLVRPRETWKSCGTFTHRRVHKNPTGSRGSNKRVAPSVSVLETRHRKRGPNIHARPSGLYTQTLLRLFSPAPCSRGPRALDIARDRLPPDR